MKETMRAAVFKDVGQLAIEEVPVPKIERPDQIIVKVEMCSICGTDVHIMEVPPGYVAKPGTILGHELVGEVVEIGSGVKKIKVGDRVVCNPNDYCGVCEYCRKNMPNFCTELEAMGIEVNGGFAEYVRITEKVAYKVADDLPSEIAAFAEPLACFMNGRQKISVKPGDSVLICGAGAIGLMALQVLKQSGAKPIIVSEPFEGRRQKAEETGADYVIDPTKEDPAAFVKELTGIGADFAIDVVGSQLQTCIDAVHKGGTVLLFGVNAKAEKVMHQADITMNEIRVLGTWIANASFPLSVRLLESGLVDFRPLITHTFPLEQVAEGIETLRKGEGIKIMIDPRI